VVSGVASDGKVGVRDVDIQGSKVVPPPMSIEDCL
jgi:hypothetical protein